jgi:hypothetical protein
MVLAGIAPLVVSHTMESVGIEGEETVLARFRRLVLARGALPVV